MKIAKKFNVMLLLFLCFSITSCAQNRAKEQKSGNVEDPVAEKIGTIVNQKWSTYKYRSHFKITPYRDSSVTMYSRLIKNETGDYYIYTIDLFVRDDKIIYEGRNFAFDYNEFLELDNLLLDCNPIEVTGDFTPEDKFMNRTYSFNKFEVKVRKAPGTYSIMYFSNDF